MSLKAHPIIEQYIRWNAFGDLLGMDFEIPEKGQVLYFMTVAERHLATPVASHGGAVAALMDAALGVACLSQVCETNHIVSTVTLNILYLSPARLGDQLIADAKVIKSGKRLQFTECTISNQSGTVIATGTATMNAYPVEKVAR